MTPIAYELAADTYYGLGVMTYCNWSDVQGTKQGECENAPWTTVSISMLVFLFLAKCEIDEFALTILCWVHGCRKNKWVWDQLSVVIGTIWVCTQAWFHWQCQKTRVPVQSASVARTAEVKKQDQQRTWKSEGKQSEQGTGKHTGDEGRTTG